MYLAGYPQSQRGGFVGYDISGFYIGTEVAGYDVHGLTSGLDGGAYAARAGAPQSAADHSVNAISHCPIGISYVSPKFWTRRTQVFVQGVL